MSYLISPLRQLDNLYKIELILTLGPALFVFVGAGKLNANDPSKAQVQYTAGLKLKKV
jgi:hypothetical protein